MNRYRTNCRYMTRWGAGAARGERERKRGLLTHRAKRDREREKDRERVQTREIYTPRASNCRGVADSRARDAASGSWATRVASPPR